MKNKKAPVRSPKNATLTVSIPKEMKQQLQLYCEEHEITASQLMRITVKEALGEYKTDPRNIKQPKDK